MIFNIVFHIVEADLDLSKRWICSAEDNSPKYGMLSEFSFFLKPWSN